MSVEKNVDETTVETNNQKNNDNNIVQKQTDTIVGDDELKQQPDDITEEKNNNNLVQSSSDVKRVSVNTVESTLCKEIKAWFDSLSVQERTINAAFADRAFLTTFMAFASPWSTTTNNNNDVEWGKMVSIREFEDRYETFERSGRNTPKQTNKKQAAGRVVATESNKESVQISSNNDNGDNKKIDDEAVLDSYAFRIQQQEEACKRLTSCNFVDQVTVMFPSAFKHVVGRRPNPPHPYALIRPSFFENNFGNNGELFLGEYQLTSFDDMHSGKKWIRCVSERYNSEDVSVPLILLLQSRFQWAVHESFVDRDRRRRSMEAGKDKSKKDFVLNSLGEVLVHCRARKDLTLTINAATLSTFVEPLVKNCFWQDNALIPESSVDVECMYLTPLPWIVSSCKNASVNFAGLDNAIEASFRRMESHGPASKFSDALQSAMGLPISSIESSSKQSKDSSNSSPQKKKKKKAKKRKGKRNTQNDQQSGTSKSSTVSEETKDAEKASGSNNASKSVDNKEFPNGVKLLAEESFKDASSQNLDKAEGDDHDLISADSDASTADLDVLRVPEPPKTESISISRHDGRIAIAPLSSGDQDQVDVKEEHKSNETSKDDGDAWETVEVRGRGSRKKTGDKSSQTVSQQNNARQSQQASTVVHDAQAAGNKKSKHHRQSTSKKKNATRKMVREILYSVIDSVEEEIRNRPKPIPSPPRMTNSWKNGPPGARPKVPSPRKDFASVVAGSPKKAPTSLRDIVVGKRPPADNNLKKAPAQPVALEKDRVGQALRTHESPKKAIDTNLKSSPGKRGKNQLGLAADQNTAPTYQETVSAVSAGLKGNAVEAQDRKSDSSSGETDEAPQNRSREVVPKQEVNGSSSPPLPTLLSAENANSATSSVASSLDAPHGSHIHHRSNKVADVNDVGYHLLDVCDRLSRDMSLFMSRRAIALSVRRRERGAILAALQDSVSTIWPGRCHVEPYGSCATQLDLPSSDIDVVILGLDRSQEMLGTTSGTGSIPTVSTSKSASSESIGTIGSGEEAMRVDEGQQLQQTPQSHMIVHPYGMMSMHHLNAERVMRLAADLESKPWAVQVRAIPTASVPVIKVLADPSRVSGVSGFEDWSTKHQSVAAEAASVASNGKADEQHEKSHGFSQQTLVPWRGSDVMKGLLSLDITFEGPEHGGIGSTEFSAHVVAEACAESGLHPDATPLVQVVMVLKELLAQRKLNEPYSGGLSSYALLLLVVALVRERAVIREEIERIELQRKAMASGELTPFVPGASFAEYSPDAVTMTPTDYSNVPYQYPMHEAAENATTLPKNTSSFADGIAEGDEVQSNKEAETPANTSQVKKKETSGKEVSTQSKSAASQSSWATIAKKSEPKSQKNQKNTAKDEGQGKKQSLQQSKKPSFADAVAGSTQNSTAALSTSSTNNSEKRASHIRKTNSNVGAEKRPDNGQSALTSTRKQYNAASIASATSWASYAVPSSVASVAPSTESVHITPPVYPQGYNDIVEVLCSGETTAGKLLMHFLLYYGQHFDAQSTAIDISGKHERGYSGLASHYFYFSPYIQRRAPGSIDPITGMLTVDPIVIYDPLEGAENNNVSRRCFAWNSVRWIFAQSYATLASAVERSATPPATPGGPSQAAAGNNGVASQGSNYNYPDNVGDLMDPSSPLLRCLLSF